jgi:hypothetical protein
MDDNRLPALWGLIGPDELAHLTGAHITSARRWKRLLQLPRWLQLLIDTVHRGRLDAINPAWRGWMINPHDGQLVTPEGTSVTQGQIRALPFLYAQLHALRAQQRATEAHAPVPRAAADISALRSVR